MRPTGSLCAASIVQTLQACFVWSVCAESPSSSRVYYSIGLVTWHSIPLSRLDFKVQHPDVEPCSHHFLVA